MRAGGGLFPHGVVLLAGGDGKRAGGPKAWRPHEGRPLLERQLEFLLGLFDPQAVAVTIQKDWLERCRKLNTEVRWVPEAVDNTPLAALQSALRPLSLAKGQGERGLGADHGAFVYHVDMPVWDDKLFARLAEAASPEFEAVAPSFQGRKGHPVLLSAAALRAVLELDPGRDRLDFWLRTRKVKVVEVSLEAVLENWNEGTPHPGPLPVRGEGERLDG